MVWKIVIQLEGEEPTEAEVEELEAAVAQALDNAAFDYLDVAVNG
jgi:hypothetical protein